MGPIYMGVVCVMCKIFTHYENKYAAKLHSIKNAHILAVPKGEVRTGLGVIP